MHVYFLLLTLVVKKEKTNVMKKTLPYFFFISHLIIKKIYKYREEKEKKYI
jgi:hypothetical protein